MTGLGALQNQLLQQGLTANDLATVLSAQANVNTNNMAMNTTDMSSNMMPNTNMNSNVIGNPGLSSGPLSGMLCCYRASIIRTAVCSFQIRMCLYSY